MAPKSRKSVSSWHVCEICNAILSAKDLQIHADNSCIVDKKEILVHGFIKHKILCSTLEEMKFEEDIKNMPSGDNAYTIFLSESAMQLCDIAIGSQVLIKGPVGYAVRTAWPMYGYTLTTILMTKDGIDLLRLKSGVRFRVEALKTPPLPAAVVNIEPVYPSCSSHFSDEVMSFLAKKFLGKVFIEGNTLYIRRFGKKICFKVLKCLAVESKVGNSDSEEDREIIQDLENLSITSLHQCSSFIVYIGTVFKFSSTNPKKEKKLDISCVGGLDDIIKKLQDFMEMAWNPSYRNLGIGNSNGALLFGATGTGKTLLIKALSNHYPIAYIEILGSEVCSKYVGEAEAKLRGYFHLAKERSPCLIFIDEIDALCPYNIDGSSSNRHQEQRITATLISLLGDLNSEADHENSSSVIVIGATSHIAALDPRLRCPGRLDLEIELPIPGPSQRLDILQKITSNWHGNITLADESILEGVAAITHGHVGADLSSVCSHAISCALKRTKSDSMKQDSIAVHESDFLWATSQVKPSAMREVLVEVPDIRWSDIGGQHELKLKLRQAVEWPLQHPDSFERLGIMPPKGLLMFGPPGCSKTMIAKALATESGLNFISIKGPELFSKWVGESERAVREVFRRARQVAPAVIFFDELDALGGERGTMGTSGGANVQERVLAQLLTEMDGITPLCQVTIVAATNRPDRIDKALLRPGRLDQIVYVPLPDDETRKEILVSQFKKSRFSDDVSIESMVKRTTGYSGAEVLAVCYEAGMIALSEDISATCITRQHVEKALDIVKPRTPLHAIELYESYMLNN